MLESSHSASSVYQKLTEMRSVRTFDLYSAYISQILEPSPQRQLKFWLNNWRHKRASCRILFESKYVSKKESTNTFYVDILFEIWVRGCKFWLDSTIFFFEIFDTYFDLGDILKKVKIWFRIWKCWENCRQISLCALTFESARSVLFFCKPVLNPQNPWG